MTDKANGSEFLAELLVALLRELNNQGLRVHVVGHSLNLEILPRGYKTFSMLNSTEHEISNAHKFKYIKKFSFFLAQISLECYFSCS